MLAVCGSVDLVALMHHVSHIFFEPRSLSSCSWIWSNLGFAWLLVGFKDEKEWKRRRARECKRMHECLVSWKENNSSGGEREPIKHSIQTIGMCGVILGNGNMLMVLPTWFNISSCSVMIYTTPFPMYLPKSSQTHSMRLASLHALAFSCRVLWTALTRGWQVLPGIGELWETAWKSSLSNSRHDMYHFKFISYHFQGVCGTP